MKAFKELEIKEFVSKTASAAPAPGGGSGSALVGALAAALAEMVGNLTVGKKGKEAVWKEAEHFTGEAALLREELLDCMERDHLSFQAYMDALHLPKETEEEKAYRREKMQEGLKGAALAPLGMAETVCRIFPVAAWMTENGNPNAVTDGLTAAILAKAAVSSGLLNVEINLRCIRDEVFCEGCREKMQELLQYAAEQETRILKQNIL